MKQSSSSPKSKRFKSLSIIIPAYNEAATIQEILRRVKTSNVCGLKKEIVFVDDGSSDDTLQLACAFAKQTHKRTNIRLLRLEKNMGKGAAIQAAIPHTNGDIVLLQDADLEYNPRDYPALLTPILEGIADVVYGSRFISPQPHRVLFFWHYVANRTLTTISNMFTNLNLTDMETGYKVFDGELIRGLGPRLQSNRFGFEPEITALLARVKEIHIYEVGISYAGRTYAQGKKIGAKDGFAAFFQILYYNLLHAFFSRR